MSSKCCFSFHDIALTNSPTLTKDQLKKDIASILSRLMNWSKDKKLGETSIVDYSKVCKIFLDGIYMYHIEESRDFYLLALWNGQNDEIGSALVSVSLDDKVGAIQPKENAIDDGDIIGFSRYFCFPKKDLSKCIAITWKFHHHTGKTALEEYLTAFLNIHCKNSVVDTAPQETTVKIELTDSSKEDPKRIKIERIVCQTDRDTILENYSRIRKISHKCTYTQSKQQGHELWQRLLINIGVVKSKNRKEIQHDVQSSISYTPTKEEIENIFINFDEGNSVFSDIGFKFEKDSKVLWLAKSYEVKELELQLSFYEGTNIPKFERLFDQVQAKFRFII